MDPSKARYTKDHEWIDGESGTIGITDHAQAELGDIVFVELPEEGRAIKAGEVLGTIESVKAVSELYAPASGTVAEVNAALTDKPEAINKDPYGAGWICRLELSSPAELDALMDAEAYASLVEQGS